MHTASLGKARWAHLSTSHHIKPEPLGELRLDIVTSAEISPSRRTSDAVCIFSYEFLSETANST